mgnify:CR=1 FL=1
MEDKYKNAKIYKIVDVGYAKCYIGSTYNTLKKRMSSHVECYNSYRSGKCGRTTVYNMFDEFGVINCKIELIENYPCNNRDELNAREGYWQKQTECVNKVIVGRTNKEYHEQHKEELNRRRMIYARNHVEQENASKAEWAKNNPEKVKEAVKRNNAKRRTYLLEKVECECGCKVTRVGLIKHCKTKKHDKILTEKSEA